MHISDSPKTNEKRNSGRNANNRLSVYFEQDLIDGNESLEQATTEDDSFNASLEHLDDNNNDSQELAPVVVDDDNDAEVVHRRKNSHSRPHTRNSSRSRERNFVIMASGAVVGGARTVARKFKRISLIESGKGPGDRTAHYQTGEGTEERLEASVKLKHHYNSTPSLRHSYSSSLSPLNQLQTSGSVRSLGSSPSPSPSPRSSHSQSSGSAAGTGCNYTGNTAKQHEQQSAAAVPPGVAQSTSAAAAAAAAAASGNVSTTSNGATAVGSASSEKDKDKDKDKDKEKEKKRKEVSSSRVKKFHRHFTQVSKDEKLINYFSCALVSDILLQGHLYITDQHFAFYSNVFGYVTKVVIPTTSVTKISKEKMAKIIPNAVGVATMDERHVFGSFISRESAFRLMCTVCPQLAAGAEILPKPLPVDSEMPEEFFNEDDSSCSISGNESPPQLAALDKNGTDKLQPIVDPPLLRQRIVGNAEPKPPRHSDMPGKNSLHNCLDVNGPGSVSIRSSAPPIVHYEEQKQQLHSSRLSSASTSTSNSANVSASSTGPPSSSSSPITVVGVGGPPSLSPASLPSGPMGGGPAAASSSRFLGGRFGGLIQAARSRLPVPSLTELHVLYLGIMLSIMLALFSAFLLYRILDIEAKTSLYHTPIDFNWHNAGNDEDIFAEALRWQKELQAKSTAEAQHILSKNLEQITKVRRSLETLSMLIHDRRSGYGEEQAAGQSQQDLDLDQVVTASGQSHSVNSD